MVERKSLRQVALPAEHGGWGFWMEPALLGMLVAPSFAGFWIVVASLAAFLTRQPLKITMVDTRRGKKFARTKLAERFTLFYGAVTVAAILIAISLAGVDFLLPFILISPFAAIQLFYDARNSSRHALPELSGPAVMASFAASIAIAGGWSLLPALMLMVILLARSIPSILYVRARLRAEKGKPFSSLPSIIAHSIAIIVLVLLALMQHVPVLSTLAAVILLVRAGKGLSVFRRPVQAKTIGFQEIFYGLLTVILTAIGYAAGY